MGSGSVPPPSQLSSPFVPTARNRVPTGARFRFFGEWIMSTNRSIGVFVAVILWLLAPGRGHSSSNCAKFTK